MRVLLSFFAASALIVAGLFVNSATADESPHSLIENTDSAMPIAADTDGQGHYKKCQGCHAKDGSGQTKLGQKYNAPDFRDPAWQKAHSLDQIKASIRNGVPDTKMPAFKPKRLNDTALDAVAKYVKSFGR